MRCRRPTEPIKSFFSWQIESKALISHKLSFLKLAPPSLYDHIWKYGGVIKLKNIPSNIHLRFKIDWLQLHILNHSEIEILWSASRRHIWENNWLKLFWSTKLTLVDKIFWWTKKFNYNRYDLFKPNFNQLTCFGFSEETAISKLLFVACKLIILIDLTAV